MSPLAGEEPLHDMHAEHTHLCCGPSGMNCRHDPVLAAAEVALHLEEHVLSKGTATCALARQTGISTYAYVAHGMMTKRCTPHNLQGKPGHSLF